jgi:uncharacterized membrane protein
MNPTEEVVHPEEVQHPPPPVKDRVAAWIADKCATVEFALVNLVLVGGWAVAKVEAFPFPFLTLVLSVEAILLTVFVLVQQRLQAEMQRREIAADLKNDAIAAETSQQLVEQLTRIENMIKKGA